MKRALLVGLVLVATACGAEGVVVETHRIGDSCTITIHQNDAGHADQDDTYPISCEISLDTTP